MKSEISAFTRRVILRKACLSLAVLAFCVALQHCGSTTSPEAPTPPPPKPKAVLTGSATAACTYYSRKIWFAFAFTAYNTSSVGATLTRVETFLYSDGYYWTGPSWAFGAYIAPQAEYSWKRLEVIDNGPRYPKIKAVLYYSDDNGYSSTLTISNVSVLWFN
jgi:hypothetical protein